MIPRLPALLLPALRAPVTALLLSALLPALSGCVRDTQQFHEIALDLTLTRSDLYPGDGPVELQALGGLCGDPGLTYPRCEIDRLWLEGGDPASWTVLVPQEVVDSGGGLLVYAWTDQDGDGVLCAPGVEEPAGISEVPGFPAFAAEVEIRFDQPCAGPEIAVPG